MRTAQHLDLPRSQVIAALLVRRAQEKLAADPEAAGWQYLLDRWNASSLSINVYRQAAERQAALTAHSASRSRGRS